MKLVFELDLILKCGLYKPERKGRNVDPELSKTFKVRRCSGGDLKALRSLGSPYHQPCLAVNDAVNVAASRPVSTIFPQVRW